MACKRVVVTGRVQGVCFRDGCRQAAERHGLGGWVRNLPDRSVEALFEGRPEGVDALVAWVRHGPPAARVEDVRVSEEEPQGRTSFEVRPTPPGA
jgi:acylphosphatase